TGRRRASSSSTSRITALEIPASFKCSLLASAWFGVPCVAGIIVALKRKPARVYSTAIPTALKKTESSNSLIEALRAGGSSGGSTCSFDGQSRQHSDKLLRA